MVLTDISMWLSWKNNGIDLDNNEIGWSIYGVIRYFDMVIADKFCIVITTFDGVIVVLSNH